MITKFDDYGFTDQRYLMTYCDQFIERVYYPDGTLNQGLYTYSEIKNRVRRFCRSKFPRGLKDIPNPLKLYRLLNVGSQDDINKNNLGNHFVGDKKMFYDEHFLDSASILNGNDEIKKFFLVTIETTSHNLDIDQILGNRAEYPLEYEFTLKDDTNLKIVNVEELDRYFYLE